jgi:predicted transcriptional regulator/transcriptional regulator with XRE-family HTH domain
VNLGERVRRRRLARGLSLALLAREAGAATSYVWLLVQGRIAEPRPARLQALAAAPGCSVPDLTSQSPSRDADKEALLDAVRRGTVFRRPGLPDWGPAEVGGIPDHAVRALRALLEPRQEPEGAVPEIHERPWSDADDAAAEPQGGTASREDLEQMAVALRRSRPARRGAEAGLQSPQSVTELKALARRQGLDVEISRRLPSRFISRLGEGGPGPTLYLSERLAPARCVFNLARGISLLVLRRSKRYAFLADHPFAEKAAVDHLAGAILIPKPALLRDVAALEYDVDALAKKWNSDWETVAIRCAQIPPEEGVPFHSMKADPAGDLVGLLPGSGLSRRTASGACPKWGAVRAFLLAPLSVHRQYTRLPSGERCICSSRVVCYDRSDPLADNPYLGCDSRRFFYSITLGCRAEPGRLERIKYAKESVHTDEVEIPIGPGCAACEWEDCSQRVRPRAAWTDYAHSPTTRKWSRFSRLTAQDQRALHGALPPPRGRRPGGGGVRAAPRRPPAGGRRP